MEIKRTLFSAGIALLMLAGSSCDSDVFSLDESSEGSVYEENVAVPIATWLSMHEEFSEYVNLLEYTGYFSSLNQSTPGVDFTAFVPDNEAMCSFYEKKGVEGATGLDMKYAKALVRYHILGDSIQPSVFITSTTLENIDGTLLAISFADGAAGQPVLNGEARVTGMGISASNGKIYSLDATLTPLVESVADRLKGAEECTIMSEAVKRTGWMERIATLADTLIVNGEPKITKHYYTLLNVDDATFGKAGIGNVDELLKALRLRDKSEEVRTDSALLMDYVSYHIFANKYTRNQLSAMNADDTVRLWTTSAANQILTVSCETDGSVVFNKEDVSATFVEGSTDIPALNGSVHYVSSWLPVYEPGQATLVWDLADFSDVKSVVEQKAGQEYYQPEEVTGNEVKVDLSGCQSYSLYSSKSDTKNSSYHYIDYATCQSAYANALNNDRVVFNVGYLGHFTMNTPTIVKGKYKVEVSIVYTTKQSFIRTMGDGNGGMLHITFDGKKDKIVTPYTQIGSSFLPGVYTATLYDEVEFSTTASHAMKFVVMDPAASTNSSFCLQFDAITFTPIK